jgi:N utilization substance protein B
MTTRRRAREVVLQMLFQLDFSEAKPAEVVDLYRGSFGEGPLPDGFAVGLFLAVAAARDDIDARIAAISDNWRLERMSGVDRNILRLAVHEILFSVDVPPRVAINEAVELAKRFGTVESSAFVNGILDRIAHDEKRL